MLPISSVTVLFAKKISKSLETRRLRRRTLIVENSVKIRFRSRAKTTSMIWIQFTWIQFALISINESAEIKKIASA